VHHRFPYRLIFEKAGKRKPVGAGPFKFGEHISLSFRLARKL
jgi:hypothetical protein